MRKNEEFHAPFQIRPWVDGHRRAYGRDGFRKRLPQTAAQAIIEAVGLLAAAVVALQITETIAEEEVIRDADISAPTRVRRVHLGHEKHGAIATKGGNAHNGTSAKTIKGEFGDLPIEVPRDRDNSFDPVIITKGQTRFPGFDDNIISLYARGMTTREIQGHLEDIYGVDVSPSLVSAVTDAVADEVKIWQNRPLDLIYSIVYMGRHPS